ncbi:MAG: CPBP family intramembrane metalloprotease [Clostridia bacterium]|nr:CPBP family intramembrane metalloprotease [Clostridia bacterium]
MRYKEIKKNINRICLSIFVFIGIVSALQVVSLLLFSVVRIIPHEKTVELEIARKIFDGFSYLIGYIFAILFYKAAFKRFFQPMKLRFCVGSHPIASVFAALGMLLAISNFVGIFNFGGSEVSFQKYQDYDIVLLVFTSVLIPAFCEELFFRGLILTNLLPHGKGFAIIASSAIFGLVHGNHDQILFATLSGLILGWLYCETESLYCGVIVHIFNNLIATIETVLLGNLSEDLAIKICILIEFSVLLFGVISIVYLLFMRKREPKNEYPQDCTRFTLTEYMKGFFSLAMIVFICYVVLNEIVYVYFS